MSNRFTTFLVGMMIVCACVTPTQAQVPSSRRATLGQGINIDRWLHFGGPDVFDYNPNNPSFDPLTLSEIRTQFPDRVELPSDSDLDYIRGLGLKHIRVPVSFSRLTNPANIGALRNGTNGTKNHLADLRSVIAQITAKGMGVIVCPFDVPQSAWDNNPSYQNFWRNLARELSLNPGQLTLESAVL